MLRVHDIIQTHGTIHSLTSIRSSIVQGLNCGVPWRNLYDVVLGSRLGLVHTRRHHSAYRRAEVCSHRNDRNENTILHVIVL